MKKKRRLPVIVEDIGKPKVVKLTLGSDVLRVKKLLYLKFKKIGIHGLDKPQRFRTLELMQEHDSKFIDRKQMLDEHREREWFACERYNERVNLMTCVYRLTIHPTAYPKCKECGKVGKEILKTCIGVGFKDDSTACSMCDYSKECQSIMKLFLKKIELKEE